MRATCFGARAVCVTLPPSSRLGIRCGFECLRSRLIRCGWQFCRPNALEPPPQTFFLTHRVHALYLSLYLSHTPCESSVPYMTLVRLKLLTVAAVY